MKYIEKSVRVITLFIIIACNVDFLNANVLIVTSANDSGMGSLRDAVNSAINGDSVLFDLNLVGDTIHLTSGQIHLQGNISVIGISPDSIIITADSSSSIFKIDVQDTIIIENLNLIHGFSVDSGGAIFNKGKLTMRNCYINHCVASYGGGIANSGSLTLTSCRLSGNNATNFGGGIASISGSAIISNSLILNNSSGLGGGGIAFMNGNGASVNNSNISSNTSNFGGGIINYITLNVTNSEISFNRAITGSGGGIQNSGNAKLTICTLKGNEVLNSGQSGGAIANLSSCLIISCTIDGNSSQGNGGGVYNEDVFNATNSTFSNNSASTDGGGINNTGQCIIASNTVSGNSAGMNGGGIWTSFSSSLGYTTITNNAADSRGGGIWNDDTLELLNTLITSNTANLQGPEVFQPVGIDASMGHNLIADTTDSKLTAAIGDILGNSSDPIDPKIGSLQNNSGNTLTHALQCGSPAIDAGDPANAPGSDQRGLPRIFGFGIDIGSFEAQIENVTIFPTITPESASGIMDGAISLQVEGGFPPYTYNWSGGESTSSLTDLSAGTYQVTVTDLAGCSSSKTIVVQLSTGISNPTNNGLIKTLTNPIQNYLTIQFSDYSIDGNIPLSISFCNLHGQVIFLKHYEFQHMPESLRIDIPAHFPSGIYFLSLTINGQVTPPRKVCVLK